MILARGVLGISGQSHLHETMKDGKEVRIAGHGVSIKHDSPLKIIVTLNLFQRKGM
jgi:hypothetical protein